MDFPRSATSYSAFCISTWRSFSLEATIRCCVRAGILSGFPGSSFRRLSSARLREVLASTLVAVATGRDPPLVSARWWAFAAPTAILSLYLFSVPFISCVTIQDVSTPLRYFATASLKRFAASAARCAIFTGPFPHSSAIRWRISRTSSINAVSDMIHLHLRVLNESFRRHFSRSPLIDDLRKDHVLE